ncbi:MAG: hypothetical protein AB7N29_13035 [Vicinamibacterales bacterium]
MTMPAWLEPMAATLTEERFASDDWVFERKFDGIRLLAYKRGARVELFSRNHLPQSMPEVAAAVAALPASNAILDGEVDRPRGRARRRRIRDRRGPAVGGVGHPHCRQRRDQ